MQKLKGIEDEKYGKSKDGKKEYLSPAIIGRQTGSKIDKLCHSYAFLMMHFSSI